MMYAANIPSTLGSFNFFSLCEVLDIKSYFLGSGDYNENHSLACYVIGDTDMDSFGTRGDSLEAKFAYDQELQFKMIAKRNYRLGMWAAELLGKNDSDAEEYARSVVKSDFEEPGEEDVVRKVVGDLADTETTEVDVRAMMESLLVEVKKDEDTS